MKKAALHNLGCKVNGYETDAMQQMLEEAGYEIVPFAPGADIYIINTCSVTNIADRKSRQMLHKAKKMNPDALVVAAGCYAQSAKEQVEADEMVDIVIGNNRKKELIEILDGYFQDRPVESWLDINQPQKYEELSISRTAEHARAYLKIQDGCNQFCTYCIIPYARGRVRSRNPQEVVEEVKRLAKNGYEEVVLTGIHLDSYGTDLGVSLLELIRKIDQVEGITGIRLGSLEPRVMNEEFVREIAKCKTMCPHFHLSLQSGCDTVLKRMNRKYTTEQFKESCKILRKYFDHPAITTDIITGFPGETPEEFAETVEFVKDIDFYETHVFRYSRRRGTKADRMPDQLPESIKAERSEVLLKLNEEKRTRFEEYFIGKTVSFLPEEEKELDGRTYLIGHTKEYLEAVVLADSAIRGKSCRIRILGRRDGHLLDGEVIQ